MTDNKKISGLRRDFSGPDLNEEIVDRNPFVQFRKWLDDAIGENIIDPNAMVLSTATKKGIPSSRVVLLKDVSEKGLTFFTNYESHKAKELEENPNASLLFFWRELSRQIRISGKVTKTVEKESKEYFSARPYDSQISAWASKQSSTVPNREFLEKKVKELKEKYKKDEVPLPPFWGGYNLVPGYFEFWQGRENRLHDRIAYIKEENNWKIVRLSP